MNNHVKIVGINGRYTHSCLALFYVRNELMRSWPGCTTELCQFTINDNYYELLLKLTAGNPRYVFCSAAIWNSQIIEPLVHDLLRCLPECRVVIGGPQARVLSEKLTEERCSFVIGEIEAVGPQFYTDLENSTLQPSYRCSFFDLQPRWFDFPYLAEDFREGLLNRAIYYESSRGCPFSCSYCLSSVERRVFHKDFDVVRDELHLILAHKPQVVRFIDRTFNDIESRALAIWKFLAEEGGETLFHFEIAPDRFNEEQLDFLATIAPGRFQFEIGIQSTNPETLGEVSRRMDCSSAARTVKRLARPDNIHLHVDLILGLPYETRQSFAKSFRDVFAMGPQYIQMGLLKILPDTPISRKVDDYDCIYCREAPYSVLSNAWLDHAALSELYWFCECVEKFVNNRYFPSLWRYLRRRGEDSFAFFEQLLALCRRRDFFGLSPNQEMMAVLLADLTRDRDDSALIVELLRYDWLRCGFRYLPDALAPGEDEESLVESRSVLYDRLESEQEGLYTKGQRNYFFKKSFFLRVGTGLLTEIGLGSATAPARLGFLADKEGGLFNFCRVVVFPDMGESEG